MIFDEDKKEAWLALSICIALGQISWPDNLSQEQIDYIKTSIDKSAFSGLGGRKSRSIARWNSLDFAFEILKAREPQKSDRQVLQSVANHNGCSWTTVRKARVEMRKQDFSYARRHKQLGFVAEDFAPLKLPHINFDNFPEE